MNEKNKKKTPNHNQVSEEEKARTFTLFGDRFPMYKDCPECGADKSCKFDGYTYLPRCPECQEAVDKERAKNVSRSGGFYHKKYADVTALGIDTDTGQPMWLDKKGKRIRHDDSRIRYDMINDPRGWKATGKKVTDKNYGNHGR